VSDAERRIHARDAQAGTADGDDRPAATREDDAADAIGGHEFGKGRPGPK
jgi:hypothetical protein